MDVVGLEVVVNGLTWGLEVEVDATVSQSSQLPFPLWIGQAEDGFTFFAVVVTEFVVTGSTWRVDVVVVDAAQSSHSVPLCAGQDVGSLGLEADTVGSVEIVADFTGTMLEVDVLVIVQSSQCDSFPECGGQAETEGFGSLTVEEDVVNGATT